ncbi:MAG: hypothetical protein K6A15_00750 [Treponema sp.]|nr:hypothetical protein [Treponema sp.]
METSNNFTCLSYDTIDFLILSKYVLFGIYIGTNDDGKRIDFENEVLPKLTIGSFLEKEFHCQHTEDCNVMLVMNKSDFDEDLQKKIVAYTKTAFPVTGNFAVSINTSVTSRIMDISFLKLIPDGIRKKMNDCGLSAIGFTEKRQILLSPDNILRSFLRGYICE